MLHDKTITIFNLHEGTWYPKIIRNAHVETAKSSALKEYGPDCTDTVKIHLLLKDGKIDGYTFYKPNEYKEEGITLKEGDLVLLGEFYEDPILDSSYPTGLYDCINWKGFISFRINSVAYFSLIPHFEITAK